MRPKLAYVSPLPPVRSGISFYSSDLLPYLSRFYDIDVVTNHAVEDDWVHANATVYTPEWFKLNHNKYDRVVYHLGNSDIHYFMYELIFEVPGVVVLHDFFLGGSLAHLDFHDLSKIWSEELLAAGGMLALRKRTIADSLPKLIKKYPCNSLVLNSAESIVVHSEEAVRLAEHWYGKEVADKWRVIPLLRKPNHGFDGEEIKRELGYSAADFVVCSFGLLGEDKLNDKLLDAWLQSDLSRKHNCYLVFVGLSPEGPYGAALNSKISKKSKGNRVSITGWLPEDKYQKYLAISDMCVQLRRSSRGEVSAAVLDCLGAGKPTIINEIGSMKDVPDEVAYKVCGDFEISALVAALESMYADSQLRESFSNNASAYVGLNCDANKCAKLYHDAIEESWLKSQASLRSLIDKFEVPDDIDELISLARNLSVSLPSDYRTAKLFVDLSEPICKVAQSLLMFLMENQDDGWIVEPIYYDPVNDVYRYAREYFSVISGFDCSTVLPSLEDDIVEFHIEDSFVVPKLGLNVKDWPEYPQKKLLKYGVGLYTADFTSEKLFTSLVAESERGSDKGAVRPRKNKFLSYFEEVDM